MASRFAEFRFGWPVVTASALGIGLGLSPLPFYTLGVFAPSLTEEFGWRQDQIMAAFTILTFGVWILSPMVGFLADKIGVRRVGLVSIALFSLAMMSFGFNTGSLVVYYSLWVVLAIVGIGTLPITFTRAVNSWFFERRGLALGIALVGTGLFGFLVTNYSSFLIGKFDWRIGYVGIGMLPLIVAFPAAYFGLFESSDPKVERRAEELQRTVTSDAAAMVHTGIRFKQAVRDWRLWLLAYAFVPISFAVGGPIPNLVVMLGTKGFDLKTAAFLASLLGLPGVIMGRLIGGYLLDHIWAPAVAAVILSLPALSVLVLSQGDLSFALAASAIIFLGFAAGVEYDLMAYLVSRYFGMVNYGAIYGLLYGFFAAGAGIGPVVFARVYETTGSYDTIMRFSSILFIVGALPLLLLGKYRNFEPAPIVSDEEGPHG